MPNYPVRLEGRLDPALSRWLWLVKWILAIPHYVVLWVLWVVFVVLSVVAWFAILFTRRYPRAIFEFNVGVLRWSWRVTFYAFILGTDRYPPFTLKSDPDYRADLSVEYPERLSRGLVLVKAWLLAIPHYLVVSLFTSSVTFGNWGGDWGMHGGWDDQWKMVQVGLISLLALYAGIVLLFRARYPESIFDLVVGLERWIYRVTAYAALMRDEYPPFRLDQGGPDPGGPVDEPALEPAGPR